MAASMTSSPTSPASAPASTSPLLVGLNVNQQQAVIADAGPLLVLAGAGSGKTKVLTHRIAYMLQHGLQGQQPVWPSQVFAVTFTNKAAKEMLERIGHIVGQDMARQLWMGTFHSLCARLLRRDIMHYRSASGRQWQQNFVIYDETETLSVVKAIMKQMGLDDKVYPPRSLRHQISAAKNNGLTAYSFASQAKDFQAERLGQVFDLYEEKLSQNNALDFDDLMLVTVNLLEQQPELLQNYYQHFRHVLVDEFQDTNGVQSQLIRQLSTGIGKMTPEQVGKPLDWTNRTLTVVGDVDQSIYSWRGANFRIILGFQTDFHNAGLIKLVDNYRSTQTILEVANRIIENNTERLPKELRSTKGQGAKLHLHEAYDEREEANFIIDKLLFEAKNTGRKPSACSILYRTNVQSRALEDVLIARGIPYRMVGGVRFYERREIKDMMAYLTLTFNPADGFALKRVINVPKRGIGAKTLQVIEDLANSRKLSSLEGLQAALQEQLLTGKAAKECQSFLTVVLRLQELAADNPPLDELILSIRSLAGYDKHLMEEDPDDNESRLANLDELCNVARQFQQENALKDVEEGAVGTLGDFLAQMSLLSDLDTDEADAPIERITLMTLHAAKGLEFPIVALVGMEEGLFPHSRSVDDPEQMEEERRLMYVGVTRAEDILILSYARRRQVFGDVRYSAPSRFLKEIPPELMTGNFTLDRDQPSAAVSHFDRSFNNRASNSSWGGGTSANTSGRGKPGTGAVTVGGAKTNASSVASSSSKGYTSVPVATSSGFGSGSSFGEGKVDLSRLNAAPVSKPASAELEAAPAKALGPELKVGDRVKHIKFGEGEVAQVLGNNGRQLYNVQFDKLAGKKLLDPRYAKLELL
jgi:DNA helicase II / ATP-dependent DNA helicase PcrA